MGSKSISATSEEPFRARLDAQFNMRHPLIRLAALINWEAIDTPCHSTNSIR